MLWFSLKTVLIFNCFYGLSFNLNFFHLFAYTFGLLETQMFVLIKIILFQSTYLLVNIRIVVYAFCLIFKLNLYSRKCFRHSLPRLLSVFLHLLSHLQRVNQDDNVKLIPPVYCLCFANFDRFIFPIKHFKLIIIDLLWAKLN